MTGSLCGLNMLCICLLKSKTIPNDLMIFLCGTPTSSKNTPSSHNCGWVTFILFSSITWSQTPSNMLAHLLTPFLSPISFRLSSDSSNGISDSGIDGAQQNWNVSSPSLITNSHFLNHLPIFSKKRPHIFPPCHVHPQNCHHPRVIGLHHLLAQLKQRKYWFKKSTSRALADRGCTHQVPTLEGFLQISENGTWHLS